MNGIEIKLDKMDSTNISKNSSDRESKVYICGAGPGDPKLITVKCYELLKTCDIILYDRLVSQEILSIIPDSSEKIYVGRSSGDPTINQIKTNELMLKYVNMGKTVLRLKGGDPFIFGRGGEEAEFLSANNIDFEIIPGISSAIGSAIYSGIPLTHRKFSSSVAIVTGHEDPLKVSKTVKWHNLVNAVDTIVILMGIENLPNILNQLTQAGLSKETPVAVIEKGTTLQQRLVIGNVNNIQDKLKSSSIKPPSVIIIGNTVSLSSKINWFISNNER
ncbi:MAG: uroporphyrinogen-III C-methyltransferase [Nitrososphaeraceae archaeon]